MEPVPIPEPAAAVPAHASVLLPILREQLNDLAEIPPGAGVAQSKIATILALVQSILLNPAVAAVLPVGWKPWTAAAVAALGLIAGAFTAGRVTAPVPPAPLAPWTSAVPIEKPPVTVNVHPPAPTPVAPVAPAVPPKPSPIVPPPAITPPAAAPKLVLTLYTTAAGQGTEEMSDPALAKLATVKLDPMLYQAGTGYRFKRTGEPGEGTVIPMPCAALSRDGAVIDVVPLADAAAALRWHVELLSKQPGKAPTGKSLD